MYTTGCPANPSRRRRARRRRHAAAAAAADDNGASFFNGDTPVLFIFDGATPEEAVLIEAHGSDICSPDGQLQIRHDQVAAIRSVAKAVAAVPPDDGDAQAAAVHAALVPPVMALFRPDYTNQERDVMLDHHAHIAPSAPSPVFKYKWRRPARRQRLVAAGGRCQRTSSIFSKLRPRRGSNSAYSSRCGVARHSSSRSPTGRGCGGRRSRGGAVAR
jgi:hypothetical protein